MFLFGRPVKTPRWQSVLGADDRCSRSLHASTPTHERYDRLANWARTTIEPRLKGLVANWYEGQLRHYIGPHRDAIANLVVGAPIVMISLRDSRTLRMRSWRRAGAWGDIPVVNGSVVVSPYRVNLVWTHESVKSTRCVGRRISVTLRAFEPQP